MTMRRTLVTMIAGLSAMMAVEATAQPMSLPEQQAEAKRLTSVCNSDPTYIRSLNEAKAGSMRATYDAAAAMLQCFYDRVDARYPAEQKKKWLEAIQANKQKAAQLQ